ncbi:hypothetical protein BSKO_04129 [Bryopsis sp. KO-2023]|nr:hypothetical protein BSKO_04129 [Bryopsis sp. KO-2023]
MAKLARWKGLGAPPCELNLDFVLPTGQSFRWRKNAGGVYTGVVGSRVVQLKQTNADVMYRTIARGPRSKPKEDAKILRDYFNLDVSLTTLNEFWSEKDERFKAVHPYIPGARVLRQDPVECIFEFICSSNNNISRIQGMVERLCANYGDLLLSGALPPEQDVKPTTQKRKRKIPEESEPPTAAEKDAPDKDGKPTNKESGFFAFPTLEQLSVATEDELRELGFGYRAKYITGSAAALMSKPNGGENWLLGLRDVPYREASRELCTLPGIGPKVAACACLFSLDKHEAIPVDTHVWQVAKRYYTPELDGKSLTKKVMEQVEDAFIDRFGDYAGWAHNTLFIAELANYITLLPENLRTPSPAKTKKEKGVKKKKKKGSE